MVKRSLLLAVIVSTLVARGGSLAEAPPTAIGIYAPPPSYPAGAVRLRLHGSGRFRLHVRPNGSVASVEVLKSTGHQELDGAAIAAYKKWRFRPGVVSEITIPVTFVPPQR